VSDHVCSHFNTDLRCLWLFGVLPGEAGADLLRHTLLVALDVVEDELTVDLSQVSFIPRAARRELDLLRVVADHFGRSVRFVSDRGTAAALTLPLLGIEVHERGSGPSPCPETPVIRQAPVAVGAVAEHPAGVAVGRSA
jgi:hypothetical protein